MPNYWLTTQWPPLRTETDWPRGIYVQTRHRDVLHEVRKGDIVLFYEFKGGPAERRNKKILRREQGRQRIVAMAKVASVTPHTRHAHYTGRPVHTWKGYTVTCVTHANGPPLSSVVSVLGFPGARFRTIGYRGSGVKSLTTAQFDRLAKPFA